MRPSSSVLPPSFNARKCEHTHGHTHANMLRYVPAHAGTYVVHAHACMCAQAEVEERMAKVVARAAEVEHWAADLVARDVGAHVHVRMRAHVRW